MHICHCFKDYSKNEGGVERHIYYLSREPIRLGHHVSALVSRPPYTAEREFIDEIEEVRVNYLCKLFKVPLMPRYFERLSSLNPDIVHAHATIPNISDIAIYYALRKKKRSLLHYHFDGNAESAFGDFFASIYNSSINRYTVEKADKVITETHYYAETSPVLKHYLNKIEVVPNGVDLNKFNPEIAVGNIKEKFNLADGNIIIFAGRLVKYKGLEYLIKSMKSIESATLVIAGKGPEEVYLRKLVADMSLKNVKFVGLIDHQELSKLYRISCVYVMPSITRGENFGIAPLEAMACGTPVITSDLPGVREFVNQESGIRVKPRDISGLVEVINTILSDSVLRDKMGIAARRNAEQYSWNKISNRLMEIYKELL